MDEPLRFSFKHPWNYVFVSLLILLVVSMVIGMFTVPALLALLIWLVAGVFFKGLLLEHGAFLNRHVIRDYAKAAQLYRRAVNTGKATPQAYAALSSLCLSEGDTAEAVSLAEHALSSLRHDAYAWALFAKGLARVGRFKEAEIAARRCAQLDKAGALGASTFGEIQEAAGHLRQAAASYEKALGIAESANFRARLARIRFALGDPRGAQHQVDQALKRSPKNPDALYLDGKLALFRHDYERARKSLHQAASNRPLADKSLIIPYRDLAEALAQLAPHLVKM